jgi:hypothetical protein
MVRSVHPVRTMKQTLGLILNIIGTGIFLFVLLRLAGTTRADWDNGFPSWRPWLIVAGLAVILGVALVAF